MADIKWIKLQTDIFNHHKIKQIETLPEGDAIIVIWLNILCLAGVSNRDGMIFFTNEIPYTEEMLVTEFRRPVKIVQLALMTFKRYGMIEVIDDIICVANWEKYQSADKMAVIREQTRVRVERHREIKKLKGSNVTQKPLHVTQGNATELELRTRTKNIERERVRADKPPALKYGEYGWVKLTEDEGLRLREKLGQTEFDRCVRYLDESAQGNGNKNKWKDWNLLMYRCNREQWGIKQPYIKQDQAKEGEPKWFME